MFKFNKKRYISVKKSSVKRFILIWRKKGYKFGSFLTYCDKFEFLHTLVLLLNVKIVKIKEQIPNFCTNLAFSFKIL